jgi:hypothetical protein
MLSMRADEKGPVRQIYESANGIPHIPMPSATRLSRGKTPPQRDSQLCVPASQQVCLYRCNRN